MNPNTPRADERVSAIIRTVKRGVLLVVLLAAFAAAVIALPVRDWLTVALRWTAEHREIAWLIYIALYVVATVCLLPGLILTIAAGALFGLGMGTALASAGSVLGAIAAFFVGRTLARDWVGHKIEAWPRFRALDRALATRGFWVVLLTRLSPLFPFNLLNYAYGITAVRARDYIVASWIGMLPATVLYVYAGTLAASLTAVFAGNAELGSARYVLLGVGLAATLAVTILVARLASRALDRELAT
jgi:uncharacterized membrane protein YdjX (TVP38/TMEM64 family)